ncbi:hypothetical protein FB446DRAFT_727858 [Lentinula raphanica]|nr:hypothetical protein FB446DRAFT_727858 [Lentinula raphanica]
MSSESPTSTSPSPGPSNPYPDSERSAKHSSSDLSLKATKEHSTTAQETNSETKTENAQSIATGSAEPASASSSTPWQAIFSPQYNAYYFFNSETNETTWDNPLLKTADSNPAPGSSTESSNPDATPAEGTSADGAFPAYNALQAAAIAQGIDPSLAHLDPSLAGPVPGSSLGAYGATAKFNARTGQFTRVDARDPTHLSEYERAKRMSEFYFDVNAWEKQRAQDQEEEAVEGNEKKRKRPSKKDLERFKEQKRQKKIAKTAWLRT